MDVGEIPKHLKDNHSSYNNTGYQNPHNYPNNYISQQYLPTNIKNQKYYTPGNNKIENGIKEYLNNLKGK